MILENKTTIREEALMAMEATIGETSSPKGQKIPAVMGIMTILQAKAQQRLIIINNLAVLSNQNIETIFQRFSLSATISEARRFSSDLALTETPMEAS